MPAALTNSVDLNVTDYNSDCNLASNCVKFGYYDDIKKTDLHFYTACKIFSKCKFNNNMLEAQAFFYKFKFLLQVE